MRNGRNIGFKHCGNTEQSSVREVRDAIVVRIVVGVVSPSTEVVLSGCCGLITCGVRGIGEVAKLPGARAEVRLTRACGSGKARRRRRGRERGVDVTVREQQGWRVKHEWRKRDGDMPHAHCKHLEPCVCAMSARHAKKMCVRQESVCTLSIAHTAVATTHQDLFHQFAFHHLSDVSVNSSWFPEACSFSETTRSKSQTARPTPG